MDGEVIVIADTDMIIPGTNLPFRFPSFDGGGGPCIDGRNIAFGAIRNGFDPSEIVFLWKDGEFIQIADVNTPVPGGLGTFGRFFFANDQPGGRPALSGENVAFVASSDDRNGVYAHIDGELVVIADSTTSVPGRPPAVKFLNFGQLEGTSPAISGRNVAFFGEYAGGRGLYLYEDGALSRIADSNTPNPLGGKYGIGGFGVGGQPSIEGTDVLFGCGSEVCTYYDGVLGVLLDRDRIAPGTSGVFRGFPAMIDTCNRDLVFTTIADLENHFGPGMWVYMDGCLQLVLRPFYTQVPGYDTEIRNIGQTEGVSPGISGRKIVLSAFFRLEDGGHNALMMYTMPPPVVMDEFAMMQACFTGGTPAAFDAQCQPYDTEPDGDIDLTDYQTLRPRLANTN